MGFDIMTLLVYDINGYIGDLATNTGYHELMESLKPIGGVFENLFDEETTDKLDALLTAIDDLDMTTLNPNVKKTALILRNLAKKCEEIIIITDGVGIEDDSLTDEDYT